MLIQLYIVFYEDAKLPYKYILSTVVIYNSLQKYYVLRCGLSEKFRNSVVQEIT